MRLLRVLGELRPSGVEAMVVNAADLMAAAGVTTEVVATANEVGPYVDEFRSAGFVVHHLPLEPVRPFLRAYGALLRHGGWDVVQIHPERANFYTASMARVLTHAVVVRSVHNVFPFTGALGTQRRIQRRILRAIGVRHVSIGTSVHDVESQHYRNPSTIVPNGYDERRFHPPTPQERSAARAELGLAPGQFAIATVANCNDTKNHLVLVEALRRLGTEVVWLHAGIEQDDRPEFHAATAARIGDQVQFLGHVRRPERILAAADAYVMPSLHEGLGNAALEALAMALPCILPDVAGLRDLRAHFQDILEVDQPTVEAMIDGIQRAQALPARWRHEQGAAQAITARRFDRAQWVDGYLDVYRAGGAEV